jgi:tetratricopeptide (TPR) repeat protein
MFISKIRKIKVIIVIVGLCFLTTVCIVVYKRYSTGKNLKAKWLQTMAESRYFLEQHIYEKSKITCKSAMDIAAIIGKEDTCFSRSNMLLGEIFLAEMKLDSAEAAFKKAVDFSTGVSDHHDNPELVKPLESLANFYYFVDHNAQKAIPIYERILKIIESSNTFPASEVAAKNYSLARVYQKEKQFERAELLYFRTLDLSKSKGGNVSEVLLNIATFYQEWSKCEKAVEYADQSVAVLKKSANLLYAQFCYYAAEVYLKCEKTAQSENLFKESLSVIEKASDTQTSDLIWPLTGLAKTSQSQGKLQDAKLLYERALFIAEKNSDPNSRERTEVLNLYTNFLNSVQQGQAANVLVKDHEWKKLMYNTAQALKTTNVNEALKIAKEAFKIASEFEKDDIRISRSQVLLGEVYRSIGNLDQSERSFNDAVTTSERK